MESPGDARVCRVCRQRIALVTTTRPDGAIVGDVWRHAVEPAGHPVDPVPEIEMLHVESACDFCGVLAAMDDAWLYPTGEVATSIAGVQGSKLVMSGDAWLACGQCSTVIETGSLEMLTARCALIAVGRAGSGEDYAMLFDLLLPLFTQFSKSRSGEPLRDGKPGTR